MELISLEDLLAELESEEVNTKEQIVEIIKGQQVYPNIFSMKPIDAAETLLINCGNKMGLREMVDHLLVTFRYEDRQM